MLAPCWVYPFCKGRAKGASPGSIWVHLMAARTPAGFSQPLQRFVSSAVACCRMAVTQPYTWLSCCQTAADVMALCLWQQRKARCALRLLTDVACAVASVSCCRCYRVLTLSARHGYRPFHAMQDVLSESNGSLHVTSGSVCHTGHLRAPGVWHRPYGWPDFFVCTSVTFAQ